MSTVSARFVGIQNSMRASISFCACGFGVCLLGLFFWIEMLVILVSTYFDCQWQEYLFFFFLTGIIKDCAPKEINMWLVLLMTLCLSVLFAPHPVMAVLPTNHIFQYLTKAQSHRVEWLIWPTWSTFLGVLCLKHRLIYGFKNLNKKTDGEETGVSGQLALCQINRLIIMNSSL